MNSTVRPPKFAGSFYPDNKNQLKSDIEKYLETSKTRIEDKSNNKAVQAIIVPHAGYVYSAQVAASAYLQPIGEKKNFLVLGLSHREFFEGISISDYDYWETPFGRIKNREERKEFLNHEGFVFYEKAHENEHSVEVQLPFIQFQTPEAEFIPMVTGNISNHRYYAEVLNNLIQDYIFVISSDLSHYLPYDVAKRKDAKTVEKILDLNGNIRHDEACGADGINILIELAKINSWHADVLDYMNSGDVTGDLLGVVGYTSIIFTE